MRQAVAVALLTTLAACTPLNTDVPRGFDLTGEWLLDPALSDPPLDLKAIRRREDRDVARGRQANAEASAAFVLQDFPVLSARHLSIEQDADSMGIRYDEGNYRDVSWGERERDFWTVRTGWEDSVLVVRSTRGDIRGVETMALEDRARKLRVNVRVETGGEDVRAVRVYRRQ